MVQGIQDGADVAPGCGVKGGTVLDIKLLRTMAFEPSGSLKRILDGTGSFLGSGFQGDNHGLTTGIRYTGRKTVEQKRFQAACHKEGGSVAGAGKIIGNTSP